MKPPGKRSHAPDRALEAVALLAGGPRTFGDLRSSLGLSGSVAARLLARLAIGGWVVRGEAAWSLGPSAARLVPGDLRLRRIQELLDGLRDAAGGTALLVEPAPESDPPALRCCAKSVAEDGLAMQPVGALRSRWLSHPWSWFFLSALPEAQRRAHIAADPERLRLHPDFCAAGPALRADGVVRQQVPGAMRLAICLRGRDGQPVAAAGIGLPGRPAAAAIGRAAAALRSVRPTLAAVVAS
jgi:DNA-binding IclR family transcriptional regulator